MTYGDATGDINLLPITKRAYTFGAPWQECLLSRLVAIASEGGSALSKFQPAISGRFLLLRRQVRSASCSPAWPDPSSDRQRRCARGDRPNDVGVIEQAVFGPIRVVLVRLDRSRGP